MNEAIFVTILVIAIATIPYFILSFSQSWVVSPGPTTPAADLLICGILIPAWTNAIISRGCNAFHLYSTSSNDATVIIFDETDAVAAPFWAAAAFAASRLAVLFAASACLWPSLAFFFAWHILPQPIIYYSLYFDFSWEHSITVTSFYRFS